MTIYTMSHSLPSAIEYCNLRYLCGLSERTLLAAELSLPRSLFCVSLRNNDNLLIAMGRVIGDLGCFVQICDITVHPYYQGNKLSIAIMDEVMEFIKQNVPKCAFVNLFADVDFLYQKYGFIYPENTKGMCLA